MSKLVVFIVLSVTICSCSISQKKGNNEIQNRIEQINLEIKYKQGIADGLTSKDNTVCVNLYLSEVRESIFELRLELGTLKGQLN